ncbi:MAG: LysR family transcriptional regulator [Bacteroidota bacterium]
MTLTQLEYIVALDTHRHFVSASEKCFVTQPTLSMQIQKLEEELGVKNLRPHETAGDPHRNWRGHYCTGRGLYSGRHR